MPTRNIVIAVDIASAPITSRAQEAIADIEAAALELADTLDLVGLDVRVHIELTERAEAEP